MSNVKRLENYFLIEFRKQNQMIKATKVFNSAIRHPKQKNLSDN